MEKNTITLAGTDYQILPLSLGQMRALGIGLLEKRNPHELPALPAGGAAQPAKLTPEQVTENERATWDRMVSVVAAALSRHYPEMNAEVLLASDTTLNELAKAYWDTLNMAGLIKVDQPGEPAPAGETTQSPGVTSTPT
jgi:hypothetical protein